MLAFRYGGLHNYLNMTESDYFMGLITLIVGLFVFVVYLSRRRDYRKDAANVILGEVRAAQDSLKRVQEHVARFQAENDPLVEIGLLPSDIVLMPDQSWSKYKHLFTRKMDRHTYDSLANFYEKTIAYDRAVSYNNSAFAKNEERIRSNVARIVMDRAVVTFESLSDKKKPTDEDREKINTMLDDVEDIRALFMSSKVLDYQPRKPVQDAKAQLSVLGNLDLSIAVLRLMKLSGTKS